MSFVTDIVTSLTLPHTPDHGFKLQLFRGFRNRINGNVA